MCVRWALRHGQRHRTVPEGDVIQGGDPVKHAEADLSQRDLKGLGDASQLDGGLVPAGSLVVQSPPDESAVLDSTNMKAHICSPNRNACIIMPEEDRGEVEAKFLLTVIFQHSNGCILQYYTLELYPHTRHYKSQFPLVTMHIVARYKTWGFLITLQNFFFYKPPTLFCQRYPSNHPVENKIWHLTYTFKSHKAVATWWIQMQTFSRCLIVKERCWESRAEVGDMMVWGNGKW